MSHQTDDTIYRATASVTIANTTTETTTLSGTCVGSLTIPANWLSVGSSFRLKGGGVFSTFLTPGNVTVRIKLGGVTIATGTISNILASATNSGFDFEAIVVCRTIGASGTVMANGIATYETGTLARGTLSLNNAGATSTIDTTANAAFDVTYQWATANASNTVTITTAAIEMLN